jgi:hypothetical protein
VGTLDQEIVGEARRLLRAAEQAEIGLRLLGGVAIRLRTPIPDGLGREYGDLDFVGARGSSSGLRKLFVDAGVLRGALFELKKGKVKSHQFTAG